MISNPAPTTMSKHPQKTIPTLHNLAHSQAFRCLWAMEELAILDPSFTFHVLNYPRMTPHNTELAKHHRLRKSPIMTLESVDPAEPVPTPQLEPGILTESKLILEYINEEYAGGLWNVNDAEDKKRDVFFTQFAIDTVSMKAQFTMLFDILPMMCPFPFNHLLSLIITPMGTHFLGDLNPVYQLLEDELSAESPWFSGKKMGLADFNMQWALDLGRHRGYLDPEKHPKVWEWTERIRGREAYKRAVEKSGGKLDLKYFGMKG